MNNDRQPLYKLFTNPIPKPVKRVLWKSFLFARSLTGPLRLLPGFLIIGTQKGGTTSLYRYLAQHPQIAPALEKEVRFFDFKFNNGLWWYQGQFPLRLRAWLWEKRGKGPFVCGEASPNYLFDPRAPYRVAETLPTALLIVLLRNPVDRAYSNYQMGFRTGVESLNFEEAIEKESVRTEGELEKYMENPEYIPFNRHYYSYLGRGMYAQQLKPWLELYDPEQLLIQKSEDFFEKPQDTVDRIFEKLGLQPWRIDRFPSFNRGEYTDPMNPATRKKLCDYFAPHNQALSELLGTDFAWD